MNEVQLLRAQLAAERRHVLAVASTCADAHRRAATSREAPTLAALSEASTTYLALVVGWFEALEALCAANLRITDWRAFARIDADSIHEERALYGRVHAALPAGLALE